MAKDTFNNLPLPRREAFIKASLEEFSQRSYNDASVSRIVRVLAIAKGSVYQYFEDKKSLYLYLKEQAETKKQSYIQQTLAEGYRDFWDLFQKLYTAGSQFDLDYPLYSAFLFNCSQEKALPEISLSTQEQFAQGIRFFRQILAEEQQQGRLNATLNPEAMAYIVMQVGRGMLDWLGYQYQVDFRKNIRQQNSVLGPNRDELKQLVEEITHILKSGMYYDSR